MLIVKERQGMHANDEAYKMATTDALSSAMRMIGMGADVYAGQWTGSKYHRNAEPEPTLTYTEQSLVTDRTTAIESADSLALLQSIGEQLRHDTANVQNAVRPAYASRQRELLNSQERF